MTLISQKHPDQDVIARQQKLAKERDRSVNDLAEQAIEEYLERAEAS